jgi:excisionase family DNA binding protein
VTLLLPVPDVVLDALVERVAERVLERLAGVERRDEPEYLTVSEAAGLLRAKPQRVYDLLSDGRLARYKDGRRVLVARAELVAHLRPSSPRGRNGSRIAR